MSDYTARDHEFRDDDLYARTKYEITLDWLHELSPGTRITNVGCGAGTFNEMAADAGFRVTAFEPDPVAYARAARPTRRDVSVVQLGLEDVPGDNPNEVVVMHDVLEHLEHEASAVTQLRHIVRDSGRIIVSVPAMPSLFGLHDEELGHFRRYTKGTLRRALAPHFTITRLRAFGFTFIPVTAYFSRWRRRPYPLEHTRDGGMVTRVLAGVRTRATSVTSTGNVPDLRGKAAHRLMSAQRDHIVVVGLWHLGTVTAACLASLGHRVTGIDPDPAVTERRRHGIPPTDEPGLAELLEGGLRAGTLDFADEADGEALRRAEIVWITFDTPVDEDDRADADAVLREIAGLTPTIADDATIVVSSQLPVGSVASLVREIAVQRPGSQITVACSPENLRLGRGIATFLDPDRIVVGVDHARDRDRLEHVFEPLNAPIEWMTTASAEMTKHALNAFLATSIAFTNEIATLCEVVGARADEVERGLRSDPRVGRHAYVGPGSAFGGGTLARDVEYLRDLGDATGVPTHVLDGIRTGNDRHRSWALHALEDELAPLAGRAIAVLGLTYKVGTDTLRRSPGVQMCRELVKAGAVVSTHDPSAERLPDDLAVQRASDPVEAIERAEAVVIMTPWPEYAALAKHLRSHQLLRVVVDPTGIFAGVVDQGTVVYRTVGRPWK